MNEVVSNTVREVTNIGEQQYQQFVSERLENATKPVTETIKKNKLPLFRSPPIKSTSKEKTAISALKHDRDLFSRLYIACQTRDGDLNTFFSHENQAAPPSLSTGGKLRLGVKADLLKCIIPDTLNAPKEYP